MLTAGGGGMAGCSPAITTDELSLMFHCVYCSGCRLCHYAVIHGPHGFRIDVDNRVMFSNIRLILFCLVPSLISCCRLVNMRGVQSVKILLHQSLKVLLGFWFNLD